MRSKKIRLCRLLLKYKKRGFLIKYKNRVPYASVLKNPMPLPLKKDCLPKRSLETRPVFITNRETQKITPKAVNGGNG